MKDIRQIAEAVVNALEDKKAIDPQYIDFKGLSSIADGFVIATGNSDIHMQTLLRAADEVLIAEGCQTKVEGENSTQWILIDAGDILVHIFSAKSREYYSLERISTIIEHNKEIEKSQLF